jgi:Subtilase family
VPPGGANLCVYTWLKTPQPPMPSELAALFGANGASLMVEDVPVVVPMQATPSWSSAEVAFFTGLRNAFLQHVGTAALIGNLPAQKTARIVVIDSAPTAKDGEILPGGGSRHGDTLAHLIEDIVCARIVDPIATPAGARTLPQPRRCLAEVTSELALPWLNPGIRGADGGHSGSLVDLARAIYSATRRWEQDKLTVPGTPPRLILNLSVGWEHTWSIADCPTTATDPIGLTAGAVQSALQYASDAGALIIAAAGNDAGGPNRRPALACPGNYQKLSRRAQPDESLLTAVSGVDYGDLPLESARPYGHTGLVALGFAGVAWGSSDAAPPSLVGSSVASAVVSAISALVLALQPSWPNVTVIRTIHNSGVQEATTIPDSCPMGFPSCTTRRASACGALLAAGSPVPCSIPLARSWSSPSLPGEIAALSSSVNPILRGASFTPIYKDPRFLLPSMQVEPWTFPMPISATCPTCWISEATQLAPSRAASPSLWSSPWSMLAAPAQLTLPALGRPLQIPMLLLHLQDTTWLGIQLEGPLAENVPYRFNLPPLPLLPKVRAAYLSGFDWQEQHSIMEQLFVHR